MAKYKLCSQAGINSKQTTKLPDFTDEDFADYEDGNLDKGYSDDLLGRAMEQQNFEWWIEKVDE